jgi:hypothetical protein
MAVRVAGIEIAHLVSVNQLSVVSAYRAHTILLRGVFKARNARASDAGKPLADALADSADVLRVTGLDRAVVVKFDIVIVTDRAVADARHWRAILQRAMPSVSREQ